MRISGREFQVYLHHSTVISQVKLGINKLLELKTNKQGNVTFFSWRIRTWCQFQMILNKYQKHSFVKRYNSASGEHIYGVQSSECFLFQGNIVFFVHTCLWIFNTFPFRIQGQTGSESQEWNLATDTISTSNTHEKPKTATFYIWLYHWEQFGLFHIEISSVIILSICTDLHNLSCIKLYKL